MKGDKKKKSSPNTKRKSSPNTKRKSSPNTKRKSSPNFIEINKEPTKGLNQDYKILPVNDFTRVISTISIISFLIGLTVFSYGFSIIDGELGTTESKTFTISRSLGKGNKPGIIIFVTLAFFYLSILVEFRKPQKYLNLRRILLGISYVLLISLVWLTPWYNEDLHYGLASVIFLSILIYNILTYYLLYQNYKKNKNIFYFLIGLNIITTICLGVFAILHSSLDKDLFASFELVFAFLFGVSILVLGFY